MKNTTKILLGLAVAGGIYGVWRFVIKPKIAEREAEKQLKNYEQFENERELIAQALPQETETENFENIS
jgi:hypothetical protein